MSDTTLILMKQLQNTILERTKLIKKLQAFLLYQEQRSSRQQSPQHQLKYVTTNTLYKSFSQITDFNHMKERQIEKQRSKKQAQLLVLLQRKGSFSGQLSDRSAPKKKRQGTFDDLKRRQFSIQLAKAPNYSQIQAIKKLRIMNKLQGSISNRSFLQSQRQYTSQKRDSQYYVEQLRTIQQTISKINNVYDNTYDKTFQPQNQTEQSKKAISCSCQCKPDIAQSQISLLQDKLKRLLIQFFENNGQKNRAKQIDQYIRSTNLQKNKYELNIARQRSNLAIYLGWLVEWSRIRYCELLDRFTVVLNRQPQLNQNKSMDTEDCKKNCKINFYPKIQQKNFSLRKTASEAYQPIKQQKRLIKKQTQTVPEYFMPTVNKESVLFYLQRNLIKIYQLLDNPLNNDLDQGFLRSLKRSGNNKLDKNGQNLPLNSWTLTRVVKLWCQVKNKQIKGSIKQYEENYANFVKNKKSIQASKQLVQKQKKIQHSAQSTSNQKPKKKKSSLSQKQMNQAHKQLPQCTSNFISTNKESSKRSIERKKAQKQKNALNRQFSKNSKDKQKTTGTKLVPIRQETIFSESNNYSSIQIPHFEKIWQEKRKKLFLQRQKIKIIEKPFFMDDNANELFTQGVGSFSKQHQMKDSYPSTIDNTDNCNQPELIQQKDVEQRTAKKETIVKTFQTYSKKFRGIGRVKSPGKMYFSTVEKDNQDQLKLSSMPLNSFSLSQNPSINSSSVLLSTMLDEDKLRTFIKAKSFSMTQQRADGRMDPELAQGQKTGFEIKEKARKKSINQKVNLVIQEKGQLQKISKSQKVRNKLYQQQTPFLSLKSKILPSRTSIHQQSMQLRNRSQQLQKTTQDMIQFNDSKLSQLKFKLKSSIRSTHKIGALQTKIFSPIRRHHYASLFDMDSPISQQNYA